MTKRPKPSRIRNLANLTDNLSINHQRPPKRYRVVLEVDVPDNMTRATFNEDVVNMVNELTNENGTTAVLLTTEEVDR